MVTARTRCGGMHRYLIRLIQVSLLTLALVFPLALMSGKSITADEIVHIAAGYSYWSTHEILLNPMHPPLVKELCALPLMFFGIEMPADRDAIRRMSHDVGAQRAFGAKFLRHNDLRRILFWSRVPAAMLSFALAAVVACWATELWGWSGGLVSLFLYVFDPSITAHAQLVTTDVACALFATLFSYLLWRYALSPTVPRLCAAGVALGLGLGAKFSCVFLLPIAVLLLGAATRMTASRHRLVMTGFAVVFLCVVGYAVVWAIYLFPSDPLFYWRGLDSIGADYDPRYIYLLLGRFHQEHSNAYLLIVWLVKSPLPELLLFAAALVAAIRGAHRSAIDEAFIAVPGVTLFVAYSLLADPMGVRYVIPTLPFMFVFVGRLGPTLTGTRPFATVMAAGIMIWSAVEFASSWPDHLSYFNQIAGGWRGGVGWLDESNVDWGQNYYELEDYLRSTAPMPTRLCNFGDFNPVHEAFAGQLIWISDLFEPPGPGRLVLSSHCVARARAWLDGQYGDGPQNWMRHLEPKAFVARTYWVYEIPAAHPE